MLRSAVSSFEAGRGRASRGGWPWPAFAVAVLGALLPLLAGGASAWADPAAEPRTIADAVYSNDQAKAGRKLFRENCRTCHDRKYFGPVLQAWSGQPLDVFFDMLSATMPQSNPGALPRQQYADIIAYILDQNGFPDGDEPLDYRSGDFEAILITAP